MLLNNICIIFSGYAFKSFNKNNKGIPVIKIGNITYTGQIDLENCEYTSDKVNEKYLSKKEDIYIALSGATTGKIGLMNDDGFYINQRVGIVRLINKNVPVQYLYYFLKNKTLQILNNANGVAQPNISPKEISKYKFNMKNIDEMIKVSNELSKIEILINHKNNELIELEKLIKSRFIEMFGEVSNKQMLSALTTKITDGSHNPPKGIEKSNYLMLSSQNVYDKLVLNDVRYLSKEDFNFENKRTNIQNGDVLLTIVGTVGRTYVVRNDEKYVFQRSVAVIKPIDGVLDGIYLSAYLKTEEAINQLEAGAHGSSQKGIYLNNLKKLVIPVADFSKQLTFKSFVNQVDKSKFIYHSKYFLCDIFTLFSSTIAYSRVVSIFACPNIFCTCSIGMPLSIAFVANVLLNL